MPQFIHVTHVPVNVGLPDLESVNKEIKGKRFKSKFAPPNHKFKPPPNIKPIILKEEKSVTENAKPSRIVTRSQTRNLEVSSKSSGKTKENTKNIVPRSRKPSKKTDVNKPNKLKTEEKKVVSSSSKSSRTRENKENEIEATEERKEKCADNDRTLNNNEVLAKTPKKTPRRSKNTLTGKTPNKTTPPKKTPKSDSLKEKSNAKESSGNKDEPTEEIPNENKLPEKTPDKSEPPVYISPFVTISRGKGSARKEYEARRSFSIKISDLSSPKAGAAYFTWRLDNQIKRLQDLCEYWSKYKEQQNPPEEAISMIDVAIGQTNLLITKKFVQFRGLIDRCKNQDCESSVTCEDLHGFWDMMHIQIDNLDKRFDNLEKMKGNNWEEVVPEVKKQTTKKRGRPVKAVKASSGLMEAIRAARKNKQNGISENTDTEETCPGLSQKNRLSNRVSVIKTKEISHRNSSPGLMMMKVAQFAKEVETPFKSILKSDSRKSARSQTKTVLFRDENKTGDVSDNENDLNVSNSRSKSEGKTPTRRSSRLDKN